MNKRLKVMVTAGGTREYIDDVRVVTNISTGKLGCRVACAFLEAGAHVFYLHAKGAPLPESPTYDSPGRLTTEQFVTSADLMETMKTYCAGIGMDVVIHSAAVSDFTFKRKGAVKLSSNSAEDFIEFMRKTIKRTPKIVKKVKTWCPDCMLFSFKFTVGKERHELLNIARKAGIGCGADYVVANDKEEMALSKEHVAYLVSTGAPIGVNGFGNSLCRSWRMLGKDSIAQMLVSAATQPGFWHDTQWSGFPLDKGAK